VGGSTSTTGVGCSTSTSTAGGTGLCSAGCQLAVAGTSFVMLDDDDEE
jgi:hypothetical protein